MSRLQYDKWFGYTMVPSHTFLWEKIGYIPFMVLTYQPSAVPIVMHGTSGGGGGGGGGGSSNSPNPPWLGPDVPHPEGTPQKCTSPIENTTYMYFTHIENTTDIYFSHTKDHIYTSPIENTTYIYFTHREHHAHIYTSPIRTTTYILHP